MQRSAKEGSRRVSYRRGRNMLVLSIGLAMLLSAAVGMAQGSSPRVRLGYSPIITGMPVYAAIEQGFFTAEGIGLEPKMMGGGADILAALAGGSVDIAQSNVVSFLFAKDKGIEFLLILGDSGIRHELPDVEAVMLRKDSPIRTLKDLEGKRFGVPNLKNINWLYNMEYLARNGVNTNRITWVEIPYPQISSALLNRQVDAVVAVDPFITVLLQGGEARVFYSDLVALAPGGLVSGWVAREQWVKGNPSVVEGFARAFKKGIEYTKTHRREVRDLLPKYTRLAPELAQKIVDYAWKPEFTVQDLQFPADLLLKYGLIKQRMEVRPFIHKTALAR